MEVLGIITLIFMCGGALTAVIALVIAVFEAHARAGKLENRVAKLDGVIDATDAEIQRVANALSTKSVADAKAAILAMRST